jgi:hypothetical protein
METFALASVLGASVAVGRAALQRGPFYARFLAMLFTVHIAISVGIYPYVSPLEPLFWGLQVLTLGYLTTVITPGMWPRLAYRLVGWPAHIFMAGTLLAFPWALASVWPGGLPGVALPYAIAALGLYRSPDFRKPLMMSDSQSEFQKERQSIGSIILSFPFM